MATVSLQTVFDEARRAIETGAADKAIGIAQHILAHFPRMIEGSRLLGEACLNAGQTEQAAAVFQQVLSADPENVAAYYGLGLAQQSLEQRSTAITAFERALEIQPNLADLRTQLMRLYAETPNSAGQFRLSRAGLGRLYARGGMYGQAIDEFRAILDAEPDRDDVNVALAEALWRDGQEDEATDFCREVLERRPELLKPTVLLGYMLFAAGQPEGETLWRRAATQDATLTMARSLFDILPPIRIEEPVLPAFDEAEWRAQQARRAVAPVAPAPVAAETSEDDFFAGSWLGSTGSTTPESSHARTYDAVATSSPVAYDSGGGSDDDDLLASLLGFDSPAVQEPEPQGQVEPNVQPFALDNWNFDNEDEPSSQRDQLPTSLNDVGLEDASSAMGGSDVDAVKPFSLDDWAFDEDTQTPTPSQPAAQDDLPGIAAFSLDDLDDSASSAQPFNFEAESSSVGGVQPFSLDDDDNLGIAPFSFDTEENELTTTNAPSNESGLGDVQPFSLDEWGLDDAETATQAPVSSSANASSDQLDDLGDFKPFSLDELSLDSLETESAAQGLAGPSFTEDEESTGEEAGFSWDEPTWRTQTPQPESRASAEDESIFAKLMRNRKPETPGPASITEDDTSFGDEEANFFSVDDEPLRLDVLTETANSEAVAEAGDMPSSEPAASGGEAPEGASTFNLDDLDIFGGASSESLADESSISLPAQVQNEAASVPAVDSSTSEQSREDEQGFHFDENELEWPSLSSDQETTPFSLSELGLSDDEFAALNEPVEASTTPEHENASLSTASFSLDEADLAGLDQQPELAGDTVENMPPSASEFSLNDLGFDEADLSLFGEAAAASTGNRDQAPEMTPFSLSDLGLSDEEIAALDLGGDDTGSLEAIADTGSQEETPASDNVEPEMVPFSLSDLGLTDEEIALLNTQDGGVADARQNDAADTSQDEARTADAVAEIPPAPQGASDSHAGEEQFVWPDFEMDADAQAASHDPEEVVTETPAVEAGTSMQLDRADTPQDEMPEMVPFTLADYGLSDEELALLEQPAAETAEASPAQESSMEDYQSPAATADLDMAQSQTDAVAPAETLEPIVEDQRGSAAVPADVVDRESATTGNVSAPSGEDTVPVLQNNIARQQSVQPVSGSVTIPGLTAIEEQLKADPNNDIMRLAVARMNHSSNNLPQAVEQYKQLIKRGSLLDEVVNDLQDTIADVEDPQMLRRLHRLLGDAYMKQNRFREAMDEYSWTLART